MTTYFSFSHSTLALVHPPIIEKKDKATSVYRLLPEIKKVYLTSILFS